MAFDGDKGIIAQQIEEWVRREVAYPDAKLHGKCSRVTLRHLNLSNQSQGDVASFPVKLEDGAEDEIDPLLIQIAGAAQQDANDQAAGVQKYAVYAYFPADKTYVPRKIFRVAPLEEEGARDIMPSEPPTEKGLVSQLMRHNEAIMRHATVAHGYQLQTMQRELQRLSETNEKFASQQLDLLVLFQDTMNDATRRRLDERKEEANLAMKEEAMSKLSTLLPVVFNRLAGQPVLPVEDPSFMLMSSMLENLTEAQQQAFYNMLSDTQKMTLAEILTAYEKKKGKWLAGQKNLILGKQNALPEPSGTARDNPSASPDPAPITTSLALRDRMTAATDQSSDPVLQRLETDAASFVNRFRDMISTKKETPK